jgi:hypothetical protein
MRKNAFQRIEDEGATHLAFFAMDFVLTRANPKT